MVTADSESVGVSGRTALNISLDAPLPRELEVGAGTALFVSGTCFHRELRVRALSFVVDGRIQPVSAHSMPRLDEFQALHPDLDVFAIDGLEADPRSADDPHLRGYLSGFWGTVRIGPRAEGPFELMLQAELEDGSTATAALWTLTATGPFGRPLTDVVSQAGGGPLVAICMTTFNPPIDLFRRQIESIKQQTHTNWICIVSDDRSSPRRFAAIERELADDPRFVVSQTPRRLGFYRNFERALAMVPQQAEFVALADQDDHWYPDKLAVLLRKVRGAQLAYSDVRVIDEDGGLISDTYWDTRRNNYTDLLSVLIANSVTGAASLFRRDLLRVALPFPPSQFGHFHDHWIAVVALSLGEIRFVDRPLYDYVQHGDAVLGHEAANYMVTRRERLGHLIKDPRERVRLWRFHYFVDVSRLTQCATILELRCAERMSRAKRRSLQRFTRAERSPLALLNLWRRGLRELLGTPETLGGEWMLAYAFTWRRLLGATVRERPRRFFRLDALPPPDLWVKPGLAGPDARASVSAAQRMAPLVLAPTAGAPERVNVLIGTLDPEDVTRTLVASFNLARRLAEHGVRARIVTIEPVRALRGAWKRRIEQYSGLEGVFDNIEIALAREARDLEVSPSDRFIATSPAAAHVAHHASAELGGDAFLYLIDDYEPLLAPTGSDAALVEQSYGFPHWALFSSEPLRDYFRSRQIGVFGDQDSAVYERAIAPVGPAAPRACERRLLFLGRPEARGRANVFDLGVAALQEALGEATLTGWQLDCIGAIDGATSVRLSGAAKLELMSPRELDADLLTGYDVGLVLALTPSMSIEAIQMAAAGIVTVTNSYDCKTEGALSAISENLIVSRPTIGGVAEALRAAASRAEDLSGRARGAEVSWARDWNDSFSPALIEWIGARIRG